MQRLPFFHRYARQKQRMTCQYFITRISCHPILYLPCARLSIPTSSLPPSITSKPSTMSTSAAAAAAGTLPAKPQYHHFIPRMILRNYAEEISTTPASPKRGKNKAPSGSAPNPIPQPSPGESSTPTASPAANDPASATPNTPPTIPIKKKKKRNRGKNKKPRENQPAPGQPAAGPAGKQPASVPPGPTLQNSRDAMVNLLDVRTMSLSTAPLSRVFGLHDMYRDFDPSLPGSAQFRIEKKLSTLESRTGKILAATRKAFEAGEGEVHMTRLERDTLRKFMFIMMYRNRKFHGRFNVSDGEYTANDRAHMMRYMAEKGFKSPMEVWLHNLEAIVDLNMDAGGAWTERIVERMYPDDAMWFLKNMQMYHLAFCTPKHRDDEFVLTENAYGIFEGPNDPTGAWTDYHLFVPISPKLIGVLRSNMLGQGYWESSEQKQMRQMQLWALRSQHLNPETAVSCLEDLPVKVARNNYSRVVNNRLFPLFGPIMSQFEKHIFYFSFFPIESRFVMKINTLLLENAAETNLILYKSRTALKRAVEGYLTMDMPGFKRFSRPPAGLKGPWVVDSAERAMVNLSDDWPDAQGRFLVGLEKIARELGSTVTPKYEEVPIPPKLKGCQLLFPNEDRHFMRRHAMLGTYTFCTP